MSESTIRDRLRGELLLAARIHGGLNADAVAEALARFLPVPKLAVEVKPGDTLVLGYDNVLSADEAEQIRSRFAEFLPDVKVAFVVGCSSMTVSRGAAA